MKIKNKYLLFAFSLVLVLVLASVAQATSTIKYQPNITIPGTIFDSTKEIQITASTFPEYIKAIYKYAGIFAGAVAMFMLVYAGWQWLMAAGNSSKVKMAEDTIYTTLVGLAFLFGGYLLLSQISINLVNFKPLVVPTPKITPLTSCASFTVEQCTSASGCTVVDGRCTAGETSCSLTQAQVSAVPSGLACCGKEDPNHIGAIIEYRYAIVLVNSNCKASCSVNNENWIEKDRNFCQQSLGY